MLDGGLEYDSRFLLVNPPSPSTSVTKKELNVSINGEKLKTDAIVFQLNYNYLGRAMLVYEHSAIFKLLNGIVAYGGSIYDGKTLKVYIINASFESFSTQGVFTLNVYPISYGGERFYRSLNVSFETYSNETAEWWGSKLRNLGLNVTRSGNNIVIDEENISLSIIYVGISRGDARFEAPLPCKIVNQTESTVNVQQGETIVLRAKVLDKFDNPLRNYPIDILFSPETSTNKNKRVLTDDKGVVWTFFNAENSGSFKVRFEGCGNYTEFDINVEKLEGAKCLLNLSWDDGKEYQWTAEENESRIFYVTLKDGQNGVSDAELVLAVTNRSIVEISGIDSITDEYGKAWINLTAKSSGLVKLIAYYGGCYNVSYVNISLVSEQKQQQRVIQNILGDTYVRESPANQNYASDGELWVGWYGNSRARTFIRFDLSGVTGSIQSAKLRLYQTNAESPDEIGVYRVNSSWIESEIDWNSQPSFIDVPTDTNTTLNNPGWVEWDVTQDIRDFLNGEPNYGWCLKLTNESTTSKNIHTFYSSNCDTANEQKKCDDQTLKPQLIIVYE